MDIKFRWPEDKPRDDKIRKYDEWNYKSDDYLSDLPAVWFARFNNQ